MRTPCIMSLLFAYLVPLKYNLYKTVYFYTLNMCTIGVVLKYKNKSVTLFSFNCMLHFLWPILDLRPEVFIIKDLHIIQRFSRAGPRGRAREWATLGVHPLSWLLSNNRLEEVCGTLTKGTFSSRLLLGNQDKGCTLVLLILFLFLFLFLPIFAQPV